MNIYLRIIRLIQILIFVIFNLYYTFSYSQSQISFRQLSVQDGLSQNSAISVIQDSIGYLWIATQNGLNKYDGKKFTNYAFDFVDITRPNFSHLGKVYLDRQGGIFIIPLDRKLYKYNSIADVFDLVPNTTDISCIFQDYENNYWIGTYSKGVYLFDETLTKKETVVTIDQLPNTIYNISQLNDEYILISGERKLVEINTRDKSFNLLSPESIFGTKIVQNFSISISDKSQKQWIGTFGDGLYFKEANSNILHRFSDTEFTDPLPNTLNILDLHIDQSGRLWIATYGNGLYMIDHQTKKISHFTTEKYNPKAVHYNDILCIYEDYTGTIWFGTDGAGLSYYDKNLEKFSSFTNLQTPEDINIDVVRAITVDNKQNVWLGTSGKGLTQYETSTNSWRTFTALDSKLPSNRIMSLFYDDEDDLWIGTQGEGLLIYNDNTGFIDYPELEIKTIWNIFKDSKDQIWLSTQNEGLVVFDKSKGVIKKYKTSENGLPSNTIRIVTEDNIGNIWLGTDNDGVAKLDIKTQEFISYQNDTTDNSLSGNAIKSLYYDNENDILWIGTNGNGLNAFDTKTEIFHHFTEEDGLANNVVYAILPDEEDNLWLSSNKGISRFSVNNSFKNHTIKNYNNYADLATEFNTGAYFKAKNGNLYFGGLEGFYWFNPNNIKENSVLPKTSITGFEVLNKSKPLLKNTQLKHDQNTLTFTFSSLQFALPEKNLYQYKLSNYDKEWVQADNNNLVRYTRLVPGEYQFQVKSSNYDGIWNETPATFDFVIKAPWYFNFYSKVMYIFLFLSLLYGIYWYLISRWRMKLDLRFKEEETQRFKKLNDYKSKLYTDIAHEFRTPLTLISAPINEKLTKGNLSDYDYTNFSIVKRNTNRLTALVDQLLQLAKLEKGKLKLTLVRGNLGLFIHVISESFTYHASLKSIAYTFSIDSIDDVWYDEDAIEKIINNLLSNAIKYSSENGYCRFKAFKKGEILCLEIENSVEKTSEIQLDKLFDRFYQKDEFSEGAGVGLSLVKELVKLYKGIIEVDIKGNSIVFNLELPLNKNVFNPNDVIIKAEKSIDTKELIENIDLSNEHLEDKKEERPILLVVEDNTEVRLFIKLSLQHKYKIIEAADGKQGREMALEYVPDIILSDIRMPIMDGIKLCNSLKHDERTSHIPIILLTADAGEENELKGLESGADDFVTKPFKLRVLEKRLDNLIALRKALRNRYSQEFILKPTDISITSTDEVFLNKLQEIIDSDFSKSDFNAVTFCKKIGMSRMQLHRKLLAYTGLSTSAFIRSQRLKQAIQILKTSEATINEVAYSVGFNTPSYFIKSFKEIYKKTPSEYLQSIDK